MTPDEKLRRAFHGKDKSIFNRDIVHDLEHAFFSVLALFVLPLILLRGFIKNIDAFIGLFLIALLILFLYGIKQLGGMTP